MFTSEPVMQNQMIWADSTGTKPQQNMTKSECECEIFFLIISSSDDS